MTKKSDTNKTEKKIKVIDLFSGTGAFHEAFKKSDKFKVVFSNDMVEESKLINELNHKVNFKLKNINDVKLHKIPKHKLLCGGFPCQPFSLAGSKLGFEDERSNVFWKIIEILKHHKPRFFILENVKNLKSHDKGNTYKIIVENLEKLGYKIKDEILNTSTITKIPQNRERIYIVGFRKKKDFDKFKFEFEKIKCGDIVNYLEKTVDDKYYYTETSKIYDKLSETIKTNIRENVVYQYRRFYVRENKSGVCPTLTANMGTGGHNVPLILDDKGIRKLTPRECFNLQGFDESYKLPNISNAKLYKLAGNAVSVPVVELIIKRLEELV